MMIKTSRQLKDLTRNLSKGNSGKAQFLLRNYAMERFLERMSVSRHKDNFILKGGVLVTAMVGLDMRMTMDIDTTIRNFSLTPEKATQIIGEIIEIPLEDNIRFQIKSVANIMDELEYGGVRLSLDTFLDTMRIPLKIDISTGDQITPAEVQFQYKLMFEDRYISVWAYNLETVLSEKLEAILVRGILNTRLRDFYDVYILQNKEMQINLQILSDAIQATCKKRGSEDALSNFQDTLDQIEHNAAMRELWKVYQKKNSYADSITWDAAVSSVRFLCDSCIPKYNENEKE